LTERVADGLITAAGSGQPVAIALSLPMIGLWSARV